MLRFPRTEVELIGCFFEWGLLCCRLYTRGIGARASEAKEVRDPPMPSFRRAGQTKRSDSRRGAM